ncbi:MAG TPA: V-type ATPase subunit, partial [Acidobacteriota bacterium]|nr:V-type ATPase subunit [Acidobacteriota bacterium]
VFREAAGAPDLPAALRTICEAGRFLDGFTDVRTAPGLDAALEGEMACLDALLAELLPDTGIPEIIALDSRPHQALALAEGIGSPFITNHLRRAVDLGNIKIFLRARRLGLPEEKFGAMILRGGFLDEGLFVRGYAAPDAEIGARLAPTPYAALWESAVRALAERETFVDLERGIEDLLMTGLRPALTMVFGPEPVYAYGLAKRREFRLARIVASGKINGLPAALIGERISDTYV